MQPQNGPSTPQPKYSDELIDKYRDVYVDYDNWSHNVQSDFKERMRAIGIDVDRIYYSGFWSQGDGAMFEGRIEDWGKYLGHLGYDDPILIDAAVENWHYKWTHSGHYYHEYSVSYDDGVFPPENPYTSGYWGGRDIPEEEQFRGAVWDAAIERHDLLALTEQIQDDLRDHMRDLYRELEKEYDYLTSDEAVIEWMAANDIDENELTEQE
jgi:hypothetical protein